MTSSSDRRVRNPNTIPQSARNHSNTSLLQELEKYKFLKSRGILEYFDFDNPSKNNDPRFQQNPSLVKSLRITESERTTPIPNPDVSPQMKTKDIRESLQHPKRIINNSAVRTPQKVSHLGHSGMAEGRTATLTSPKASEPVKINPFVRGSSDRSLNAGKNKSSSSTSATSTPVEMFDSEIYNHLKIKLPANILQNRSSEGKIKSLTSRLSSPQERTSAIRTKNMMMGSLGSPRKDVSPVSNRKSPVPASSKLDVSSREKELTPKNAKKNNSMQKASSPRQSNGNIKERLSPTEKASFQMSSSNISKNSFFSFDKNSFQKNPSLISEKSNYNFSQVAAQTSPQMKRSTLQQEKGPKQPIPTNNSMVKGFSLFDKSPRTSAPNIMNGTTSPSEKRIRHPTPISSHKNSVSSIDNRSPRQTTPDYAARNNLLTIEKTSIQSSPKVKEPTPKLISERRSPHPNDLTKSYEALHKKFSHDSKTPKPQSKLTISTLMEEFTELRKSFNKQQMEEIKLKSVGDNVPESGSSENPSYKTKVPADDLKKENENIKKTLEFLQNENEALRRTVADVNKYQNEVNYYKSLAESRLKDSSTLAEEIIFLRTTLDKSHFNYLKVQKSHATPVKAGLEDSPVEMRRSSLKSDKQRDSSAKKVVRWRDELESNS